MRLPILTSLFLIWNICSLTAATAQTTTNPFENGKKLIIELSEQYGLYYKHAFKPKQTLYGISKLFGTKLDEVLRHNPQLEAGNISVGDQVIIPVQGRFIITDEVDNYSSDKIQDVYYRVRKGDNMFRIARNYFYQDIQTLLQRNDKETVSLSIGELLHVGWIHIQGPTIDIATADISDSLLIIPHIVEQIPAVVNTTPAVSISNLENEASIPPSTDNVTIPHEDVLPTDVIEEIEEIEPAVEETNMYEPSMVGKDIREMESKAAWKKSDTNDGRLYVLHAFAKKNSPIEIYNPISRRWIKATVAGRLPSNLYPGEVTVFLSKAIVDRLGIKDKSPLVRMRYISK